VPEADNAKLTLPTIVDAAIDVADSDGLGGLSMRRIADVLGVGAMSLYRHVADKDALLQEMSEEIGRRFPYPVDQAGPWTWRERVQIAVDVDWQLYRRHPWVVLAYSSPRHSFGEESLVCLDWLAAGFTDLGVDVERSIEMALTVWSFVHGVALVMVSDALLRPDNPSAPPDGLAELARGNTDPALPHLSGLATSPDAARLLDPRNRLDAGIEFLCAGFEAAAQGSRRTD